MTADSTTYVVGNFENFEIHGIFNLVEQNTGGIVARSTLNTEMSVKISEFMVTGSTDITIAEPNAVLEAITRNFSKFKFVATFNIMAPTTGILAPNTITGYFLAEDFTISMGDQGKLDISGKSFGVYDESNVPIDLVVAHV